MTAHTIVLVCLLALNALKAFDTTGIANGRLSAFAAGVLACFLVGRFGRWVDGGWMERHR